MKQRQKKRALNTKRKSDTRKPWVPVEFYKGLPLINMEIGAIERFRFITAKELK